MKVYDAKADGPQVHVLAIGIGEYPHCGASAKLPEARGIASLKSPPRSAHSIAQWFLSNRKWLSPRLGTVTLLADHVADAPIQGTLPTLEVIKRAMREWQDIGDVDDVLILYWCGHGFEHERRPLLLTRDAGKDGDLWDHTADLGSDRYRAYRSRSRTQLWLIDACRDSTGGLGLLDPSGRSMLPDTGTNELPQNKDITMVLATGPFGQASAAPGRPSYFSLALIDALEWGAWRLTSAGWQIRTTGLVTPINERLSEMDLPQQARPVDGIGQHPVLQRTDPPAIPARFRCEPGAVQAQVRLSLVDPSSATVAYAQAAPTLDPWTETVRAGHFDLQGTDELDRTAKNPVWILPSIPEGILQWPH